MNCPEHLIFKARFCQIWHTQRTDVARKYVTWREVLNLLRYEVHIGPGPGRWWISVNRDAWLDIKLSNLTWKLWGKRRFEKRHK